MTYLEIVNKVLRLMRETSAISVTIVDDIVVELVADHVNDAKRHVEGAHNWNALRHTWDVTIPAGASSFALPGAGSQAQIDYIFGEDGTELRETTNKRLAYKRKAGTQTMPPSLEYAVDGIDANRDIKVRVYPAPAADYDVEVSGFKKQADLVQDTDILLVPAQPVIYLALALAARERGEVGGQTAGEIFGMAEQYLKDAIANDAALNTLEYNWYS